MALDLFLCWLRSSRQLTTTPLGRWAAHAAFGFVLVLAAGSAGSHDVDQEVFGTDDDVDLLRLGKDDDGGRRGVNAALGLGFRQIARVTRWLPLSN